MENLKEIKSKDRVVIMGFAPDSRNEAPLKDKEVDLEQVEEALKKLDLNLGENKIDLKTFEKSKFDVWGINELYIEMPILANRANAWFQLHGTEPPTQRDPKHKENLGQLPCPVLM